MHKGKRVVVATPAYTGMVCTGYAMSIAQACRSSVVDEVVILNQETGIAEARRRLFDIAFNYHRADVVVCIDSDIMFLGDGIQNLVNAALVHESGIMSALVTNREGTTIYDGNDTALTLACTAITRAAYDKVMREVEKAGLLSPFGHELDGKPVNETDYFLALAKRAGVKMRTDKSVRVGHWNASYLWPATLKKEKSQ